MCIRDSARAWVRDALQEWEEEKAKINLPKPAEHVGNNPLQTPGFSRPDGRAQAADVAFGAMKAAEQAAKAREAPVSYTHLGRPDAAGRGLSAASRQPGMDGP